MNRIGVFFAEGYEEIEALTVVDLLRRADIRVDMVSITAEKTVKGSHGIAVGMDQVLSEADFSAFDGIVLPGGMPGTLNLEKSQTVKNTVSYCADNDRYVCAICAAPSILGHMGLLKGKTACCFPGFENELEGADVSENYVCRDGKIITAKGMGAAIDFSEKITACLINESKAKKIKESLQCPC